MGTSDRGGDFYEPPGVRAAYLRHRHSGSTSPNTVMEEPAFLDALGWPDGARVLDLGCGDHSTADLVLAMGAASYTGVDGSAGMIDLARTSVHDDRATFFLRDIEDIDPAPGQYDLAISRMALHYIDRLGPVLRRIHHALSDGGRLIYSVVHPVITSHDNSDDGPRTTWTVDDYFHRGPRTRAWFGSSVIWHHRTIEDHVRLVTDAGFRLDSLRECEPSADLLAHAPDELARRRRVPLMLLVEATALPTT